MPSRPEQSSGASKDKEEPMSTTQIPDVTVLAAIDRAERHRGRTGVPVWLIFEHLGIPRRSRLVRTQLQPLVQAGVIEQRRAHGVNVFALASNGRRRLQGAGLVVLPESPQHRAWCNARTLAGQEIERFRESLGDALEEASALLDDTPGSDVWFELAEELRAAARRLGSATYCLHEWIEPSDDRADIDDHISPGDLSLNPRERQRRQARRAGRRNTRLWPGAEWERTDAPI
jgi:hypothetical protein